MKNNRITDTYIVEFDGRLSKLYRLSNGTFILEHQVTGSLTEIPNELGHELIGN
jgi:hypothetical protein